MVMRTRLEALHLPRMVTEAPTMTPDDLRKLCEMLGHATKRGDTGVFFLVDCRPGGIELVKWILTGDGAFWLLGEMRRQEPEQWDAFVSEFWDDGAIDGYCCLGDVLWDLSPELIATAALRALEEKG
jgi:hypothetical protein